MGVLLVTGSGRGIGADIAVLAAERGWDVAVNYVGNKSAANDVCDKIEGIGRRALPVQADVSDPTAVEAMFAQVSSGLGRINGLVNNAGISLTAASKSSTTSVAAHPTIRFSGNPDPLLV